MASFQEAESREHELLVKMMAEQFVRDKYRAVRASLPGWPSPAVIGGKKPDLTATRPDGEFIILEAETCTSLFDTRTGEQLKVFSGYTKKGNCLLQIVVPKNCGQETGEQAANRRIAELGIIVDHIWWPKTQ